MLTVPEVWCARVPRCGGVVELLLRLTGTTGPVLRVARLAGYQRPVSGRRRFGTRRADDAVTRRRYVRSDG